MHNQIEWIKRAIGLIFAKPEEITEKEKQFQFLQLEKQFNSFSEQEQSVLLEVMNTQFEPSDAIYLVSYLLSYMPNQKFKKIILDNLLKCKYDCYTGSMLELQTLGYNGFYKELRQLHNKNVKHFQEELKINYEYQPVNKRNKKRIVIITEQVLSTLHAPTKVVMQYIYILQKYLGYEILLFVFPSDIPLPDSVFHLSKGSDSVLMLKKHAKFICEYRNQKIQGYQVNMSSFDKKERYLESFQLIYEWNPIFVLNIGTRNPVAELVRKFTTLAEIEVSISCPVSEADIVLRYRALDEQTEQEIASVMESWQRQIFLNKNMPVIIDDLNKEVDLSELGLPSGKFYVAIVGNRLDKEIDAEFMQLLLKIAQKAANIDFVIIGDITKCKNLFEFVNLENRVHYLGYQNELAAVCKALDLYLNPKRIGGGWSSVMALSAGLPVVTLPDCDVAYNVGNNFVVSNDEEMVNLVCRYATDDAFYKQMQEKAAIVMERHTNNQLWVQYVQYVIDSILNTIMEKNKNDCI